MKGDGLGVLAHANQPEAKVGFSSQLSSQLRLEVVLGKARS
jgi:hypothetical protein